jgi:hypothetical protein
MATFYTGYRPVLKGRDFDDSVHSWKGTVGTYSNWSLMNSSHVLDGAPNENTVLGDDSRLSRPTLLEYLWSGKHHIAPITNVGSGERLDGMRYNPLTYRGLAGAAAFKSGYGHDESYSTDYARYTNFVFDGIDIAEPLDDPGHSIRYSTTYGGAFNPWINKGVTTTPLDDSGSTLPTGYDNAYGKNKINEWRGVASARVL